MVSSSRQPVPWWDVVRHRADQPPTSPRADLRIGSQVVGSVGQALLALMQEADLPMRCDAGTSVRLLGDASDSLRRMADWLRAHDLAGRWRDELLAVRAGMTGPVLGAVERGVARNLGIHTHAVQLHARDADRRDEWWLQQRALDKASDPGAWDTLAGGLVSARESLGIALSRESWEEAGVALAGLMPAPVKVGCYTIRRPVQDAGRDGYMVETVHAFMCTLPKGQVLVNQDGEVLRFQSFTDEGIDALVSAGELTLEAAIAIALCRGQGIEA